ncbi:hypothetical protein ILUMI_19839 [Ignelater luminosus]|uniref:Uncharacterized protein n=1 Tax=Ignelater luminosus TaxID=2038154 RepID=A0A8K0G542_IGNLU|nr:hypothetical protein ILUMI_19839 [Ignelater luminosus]
MDSNSNSFINCIPSSIFEAVQNSSLKLLSEKSQQRELSEKIKPKSLWIQYTMPQSTLSVHHNMNITKYAKLKALLKHKSHGYKPKKSEVLTSLELINFSTKPQMTSTCSQKWALVVSITGACCTQELHQLKIDDIKDLGATVLIKVFNTKTRKPRAFTITGKFYEIIKNMLFSDSQT